MTEQSHECYYCGKVKPEKEGFFFCDTFVCEDCEGKVGEDTSGYCSCDCILSGYCDGSC